MVLTTQGERDPLAGEGYKTLKTLGKGGMGSVLLAQHLASGQRYAVKFLHDHLAEDDGVVDRFRLEAEALTELRHPNIVRVHEARWDSTRGPRFIVMEYLRGHSLAEELANRRQLPAREALGIAIQILDGLDATHAARLLHRDIKPDNIFVCDGPEPRTVKLTDYGIAKVIDTRARVRPLTVPTQANLLIGTPRWCSPEAFFGDPSQLDERSDLYSVGLILHWMVSGKAPWPDAKGIQAVMLAQANDALPSLGADLAWLDILVAQLTAKFKSERFESAGMAAGVLRQCLRDRFESEVVLLTTEPIALPRPRHEGGTPSPAPVTAGAARGEVEPAARRVRPVPKTDPLEPPEPARERLEHSEQRERNAAFLRPGPLGFALLGGLIAIVITLLWMLLGGRP